ncbi:Magnesium and cobalt transport protein CorA [Lunatimonas lonarensis]|uniref:Magnesium transport protein CorA n=1 Tax=Lunatimonas lonarensis TaxID=1232681 RepID=R7ZY33_9BACT|nr:magnesium/cobalt transporter CorA [Lunatimonas lonarensis]EON78928.1 Magnesium and cobalt transport protein CorA [Lunatimonas lonarensis]
MARKRQKRKLKAGLAPGTALFTGEQKMERLEMSVLRYDADLYEESFPGSLEEVLSELRPGGPVTWVNLDGLHEEHAVERICQRLDIHKLTMEDILSVGQRPKVEEHADYLHVVLRMFMMDGTIRETTDEQLSFILKGNLLLTFQERKGDVFDGVRKRLRESKGQIRRRPADYLLYALMDAVVDNYYPILETLGEQYEELEMELLDNPTRAALGRLHILRRETILLRRSVYPLREVVGRFEKMEEPVVSEGTRVFIRDLYDHTIQVIENIEVLRDIATSLLDLYMNSVSNKMNEVMKVLTIIATLFIPLTFIVGVYGMNFDYMPELKWRYGYFVVLGLMFVAVLGMMYFFRRRRWL